MARKSWRAGNAYITLYPTSRRTRIRIPQPAERPISLRAKDVIRQEEVQPDPWWFVTHKRGPRRTNVGGSDLERRAVPHSQVRGTLPERILYKALRDQLRLVVGVDFTFQSSLQGGRLEMGGIVADFVFPLKRWVIQVQGPTHTDYLRIAKDREQRGALEEMNFSVTEVTQEVIYDEPLFDDWLRLTFGLANGVSGGGGAWGGDYRAAVDELTLLQLAQLCCDHYYAFEREVLA